MPGRLHSPSRQRISIGSASPAFTFVLTMGIVNLFGDVTYEGGASINGPFMASLGLAITHMQDGRALVHMPLTPDKTDHDGAIHEGALAALLDTTGAMASWSIAGLDLRYKASTVGIHVSYHAPARAEVAAEARTWRRNDEIFLNQVTVSERGSRRLGSSTKSPPGRPGGGTGRRERGGILPGPPGR